MRRVILLFAIIFVIGATYAVTKSPRVSTNGKVEIPNEATSSSQTKVITNEEMTKVTYVVDGDTIEVEGGRRVRYIGVNTPEVAHSGTKEECFGSAARNKNISLVNGKTVRLVSDVSDKDAYGRLLRYVYVGSQLINDSLLREGFARAEPVKPDMFFAAQFLSAQEEARRGSRGLWGACISSVDTAR